VSGSIAFIEPADGDSGIALVFVAAARKPAQREGNPVGISTGAVSAPPWKPVHGPSSLRTNRRAFEGDSFKRGRGPV
jgi:hypothetical protein